MVFYGCCNMQGIGKFDFVVGSQMGRRYKSCFSMGQQFNSSVICKKIFDCLYCSGIVVFQGFNQQLC